MSYKGTPYYDMATDAGCRGEEREQMAAEIETEHRRMIEREHERATEEHAAQQCDGEHPAPECSDPQCWRREPESREHND